MNPERRVQTTFWLLVVAGVLGLGLSARAISWGGVAGSVLAVVAGVGALLASLLALRILVVMSGRRPR